MVSRELCQFCAQTISTIVPQVSALMDQPGDTQIHPGLFTPMDSYESVLPYTDEIAKRML